MLPSTAEKLICKNNLFDEYVISQEHQKELMDRYNNGETDLRDRIILSYYPFLVSVINKCTKYIKLSENDDLISIGLISLVKAFDKYDKNNQNKASFLTFAAVCIKRDIYWYLRKNKKHLYLISLDEKAVNDEDNPIEKIEFIEDTSANSDPSDKVENDNLIDYIFEQINSLPEIEKKILLMRYNLSPSKEPVSQGDIAKELGMSQSYVSRIEKRALEKIRKKVAEND